MNRRTTNILQYIGGAFTAVGLAAQGLEMKNPYFRKGIWVLIGVSAVVALTSLIKTKGYDNAIKSLHTVAKSFSGPGGLKVKYIENRGELKELWDLDVRIYEELSITFDHLLNWWRAYPKGSYILLEGTVIIGAFGLWPLKKTPFLEIIDGKRGEKDISTKSLYKPGSITEFEHWYISGIVLDKSFRKTRALRYLMSQALSLWLDQGNLAPSIRICAFAYSPEGEALLRRFGFRKCKDSSESVEGKPVYLFEVTQLSELEKLCARFAASSK